MSRFIDALCEAVLGADGGHAGQQRLLARSIADTLVVAAAGFAEPVTRAALRAYSGGTARLWSGQTCESAEAAVMLNGIAAHALDYDDVYLESATHPSAVIVPAILSVDRFLEVDALYTAFAAGLMAARAVNARVGPGHYARGWHGTGTIGAFGAAAATGRLLGLDHEQLASAFGLAAAMSGGLQINFSTMAKPCQAGFAAAAGYRAARLAAAGVTAARDVFGRLGYAALYGEAERTLKPDDLTLDPESISLKLYPCCLGAARLIGVALDVREQVGSIFTDPAVTARLIVPQGSISVLRFQRPETGLQAKFSGEFATAVALIDGPPTLASFTDAAVGRTDLRSALERVTIEEDSGQPSGGAIDTGFVRLQLLRGRELIAERVRWAIPGSREDPPTADRFSVKAEACLAEFRTATGVEFPALEALSVLPDIQSWLAPARGASPLA